MSDNDNDNSGIWWIIGISLLVGIFFFFDHELWPSLESPFLRCLVAPFAGVVLLVGYFLLVGVVPNIIGKIFLWVTTPRLVFLACLLFSAGIGAFLLFRWAVVPIDGWWALIASVAVGTLAGFITVRLVEFINPQWWLLQSVVGLPAAVGVSYLVFINLFLVLDGAVILSGILVLVFVIRFLASEHEKSTESQSHYQPINTSYLPQNMKDQILKQVRDQVGTSQYNQMVSSVGEDGIISAVLANMQKK